MISISTLWAVVIAAIGLVMTVMNIIDKSITFKERAKKPNEKQDERLAILENDMIYVKGQLKIHDGYFTSDKEQISEIKEQMRKSNRIIIQSLQSIIGHAIDGNDIEQLRESKHEIEEYLLNK